MDVTAAARGGEAGWARFAQLVREDRVHSSIFTDPDVFEAELEQIFYGSWVYVAHESEVPEPGDFCLRWIGRQSVIVSRAGDGRVRVLMNRCRHRGSTVCHEERGTARFFRCQYHGWTYGNDGRLVGVTYPDSYGPGFDAGAFGLSEPRVETHRGLVFANLRGDGPSLDEQLGLAKPMIDDFFRASPVEEIEIAPQAHRTIFHGNWKYVGMDGYHVNFTHKSLQDLQAARAGEEAGRATNSTASANRMRDLGGGNVLLDLSPSLDAGHDDIIRGAEAAKAGEAAVAEYHAAMRDRYGDEAPIVILRGNDPHVHVWPSLQVIGIQLRVIRPIAPDRTEVTMYCARLRGVPDAINEARIDAHTRFFGPAGFGQPDDNEMFERNQQGLHCDVDPWVYLARGLHDEVVEPDGTRSGNITDEVTQRGQMRAWRDAMLRAPS